MKHQSLPYIIAI